MWIMVVLLGITAVHRFAKVWRQASPQRPEPTWTTRMSRIGRRRHVRSAPEDVELTGASHRFGDRWRFRQSQSQSSRRRTRP
jgi:hypothetical protein